VLGSVDEVVWESPALWRMLMVQHLLAIGLLSVIVRSVSEYVQLPCGSFAYFARRELSPCVLECWYCSPLFCVNSRASEIFFEALWYPQRSSAF
jgi:hypothetical protein